MVLGPYRLELIAGKRASVPGHVPRKNSGGLDLPGKPIFHPNVLARADNDELVEGSALHLLGGCGDG